MLKKRKRHVYPNVHRSTVYNSQDMGNRNTITKAYYKELHVNKLENYKKWINYY